MKKWVRGAVICMLLLMLTGCYKLNLNVTIEPDGSGALAMELLMSEQMMTENEITVDDMKESLLADLSEEEMAQVTVESVERTYNDEKYIGFVVKYKDTMAMPELDLSKSVVVDEEKHTITFDVSGDTLASLSGSFTDPEMGTDLETLKMAGVEINLNITMPFEIESYEGGTLSADKKTLMVDLLSFTGDRLTATCKTPTAGSNSMGWIIGGVAAAVLVLAGVIIFAKKKGTVTVETSNASDDDEDTADDVDENAQ